MLKQNISACTFPKYPTLESCAQSVMLHVSTWLGITKRKLLSIHLKELNIVSQYKILRYFQPQYYSMVHNVQGSELYTICNSTLSACLRSSG